MIGQTKNKSGEKDIQPYYIEPEFIFNHVSTLYHYQGHNIIPKEITRKDISLV